MKSLFFDTCFLIDLERELRRGPGRSQGFLGQHASTRPVISWTVVGEFAEGFGDIRHPACAAMLSRFEVLPMSESTAGHYARITKALREEQLLIGTNDLWIAAAALAEGITLVTNNTAHFSRVPGLVLVAY